MAKRKVAPAVRSQDFGYQFDSHVWRKRLFTPVDRKIIGEDKPMRATDRPWAHLQSTVAVVPQRKVKSLGVVNHGYREAARLRGTVTADIHVASEGSLREVHSELDRARQMGNARKTSARTIERIALLADGSKAIVEQRKSYVSLGGPAQQCEGLARKMIELTRKLNRCKDHTQAVKLDDLLRRTTEAFDAMNGKRLAAVVTEDRDNAKPFGYTKGYYYG